MIVLTRLNGARFALNPDLVERADANPDTTLLMVDGTTYVVTEPIDELIELVVDFRARVLARADASTPAASETPFPTRKAT
jgi:flagellar protein FlbD